MVYLFLGTGFEEIEAVATIDVLRRAEIELTTISVMNERTVEGTHGVRIEADKMFDEADFANAEMLILPGGMPGTLNLGAHEGLSIAIREQNKKGRWIAAICAAPSILGKMHLLRNLQAVCYPGFEDQLEEAFVSNERVMVSGNIVTSKGPGCTIEFALQLATILKGEDVAKAVAEGMLVK
jgi:4-methyl-5(b-hydroxyethyl)-thiazole monophosphate biosynthesis